ncbi:MAG TPA: ABC transporter substrate-binding protein [Methylomirabilota bacterium]|nr:ABC transporter substrate-binding protein [Methylomirabilota bacterium]
MDPYPGQRTIGDIDRRVFVGSLAATLFGAPRRAFSQRLAKVPRIGVLIGASPPYPFADAFRRGLHSLGYSEGRNIALEFRYTMGRSDRAAELAAELVRLGVDVIVTHWTQTTRAALAATKAIPIVMVVGSPVQSGFVESLARPGGNATGLSGMDAEIGGKRLQILRELMPNLTRVAVLGTTPTTNPYSKPFVEDLRLAAARAGLRLEPVLISGPGEFESAFADMARAGAQAVIVQEHFDLQRAILLKLAAKHRLAYMSGTRATTVAGGLVSTSANWPALYERAAFYVDRILKGAKPADLPVEQPTKFELVINLKTAKALGLTIPQSLLLQADELIQ